MATHQHGAAASDWVTEATSMTSATLDTYLNDHLYQGGRRYHSYREGRYALPNDEIEQHREEVMHILVMDILDNNLFLAPMSEPPTKIMDLATGVGLWAVEMGDRFPDATILGVDLSPIQPTSVPPNVSFQIDDVEDTWVHDTDYDFIHMRESSAYMKSTPTVVENSFAHLRPGGWLELQEFHWEAIAEDGTISPTNAVNAYLEAMYEYGRLEGREINIVPKMGELMRKAGFVNVQCRTFQVPYGKWPREERQKRRGAYMVATCQILIPACNSLLSTMGMPEEQVDAMFAGIGEMLHDHTVRCHNTYYVWSGQKPERAAGV
ncbi:Uu.00g128250.m01.CDS01 [Anthostomella pinea]|uniref:Uu.00g128250.m01.CDS01 n=1 Tax=Anthostomella pinea TaxID=933095 RepID=A0AAI8YHZ5_9PEZI|nr:Uu.00g128250.m01.CDS01 [Anthostomella pinea]